jgi:membrane protein required for colicin V production
MNLVDILIWVVLLTFAVKGFMKGLVKEVCSLMGLLVGGWAALTFHPPMGEVLRSHIKFPPLMMSVISFLFIFLAVWILSALLGYLLTTLMKIVLLGGVNRISGAAIGLLQGALLLCLILPMGMTRPMPHVLKTAASNSSLGKYFISCGDYLFARWKFLETGKEVFPRNVLPGSAGTAPATASGHTEK